MMIVGIMHTAKTMNGFVHFTIELIESTDVHSGKKMFDAYKTAAAKEDYENKWMYFGAADGSFSIYPGVRSESFSSLPG